MLLRRLPVPHGLTTRHRRKGCNFRVIELRSSAELNSIIRARSRSWEIKNAEIRGNAEVSHACITRWNACEIVFREREREGNFIVLCCMPTLSHQSRATNYCYISSFTLQHLFAKIVADFQAAYGFFYKPHLSWTRRGGWERQSEFWSLKETL